MKNNFGNKVAIIDRNFFHFSIEIAHGNAGFILTNETNKLQVSIKRKDIESKIGAIKKVNLDVFLHFIRTDSAKKYLYEVELTSTERGINEFIMTLPKSFYKP